ncbi:MAG: hypothetical protein M3Q56_01640 [Bacteroidota bacterium]|nr:hypothetical protein [Bacteroidota bacterium]
MKQQNVLSNGILIVLVLVASNFLFTTACKHSQKENEKSVIEKVDNTGPEYTSAFICPMHCKGSGSHEMGVCPVCGMDYEKNDRVQVDSIR